MISYGLLSVMLLHYGFVSALNFSFPSQSPWYQDISGASVDPHSNQIISYLNSQGIWASTFQIDMSLNIQYVDRSTSWYSYVQESSYILPDCDAFTSFPVTSSGQIEGESPYNTECSGDCHYLVVDTVHNKLYENYHTQVDTSQKTITGDCGVVWDLCQLYPANGRGEQCTSTDAAGFPVAPLLVTADELANGTIDHAMRFTLPNDVMLSGFYVHPASHAGGPSSSNSSAIVYGSRLRLKSTFDPSSRLTNKPISNATLVVVAALKKYGMFLADGGDIPLCFADDAFTVAKYSDLNFDTHSLFGITVNDFEIISHDAPTTLTDNCVRNVFNDTNCGGINPTTTASTTSSSSSLGNSKYLLEISPIICLILSIFVSLNLK